MAGILRGDIVWTDLNPVKGHEQAGLRPALILSPQVFNERSGTVIAMALTSQPQRAGFPLTMEITSVSLPKPTWVKISQIRTLSVERIGKRMGHVSDAEMSQIVEGLNEIIGEQSTAGYRR
jgi:mRNA interferase MazF